MAAPESSGYRGGVSVRAVSEATIAAVLALAAAGVQAGAAGPALPVPVLPISPGLSQSCLSRLDPALRGAAANRAARACRRPTGPAAAAHPNPGTGRPGAPAESLPPASSP